MPQESYSLYDGSYYRPNAETVGLDEAFWSYDDMVPFMTASATVPQLVSNMDEEERENLDVELLDSASINNATYTVASTIITSASNKSSHINFDIKEEEFNGWQERPVKQWTSYDIMRWIVSVANQNDIHYENVKLSGFRNIDGHTLCTYSIEDFMNLEPSYGRLLHDALQKLLATKCWYADQPVYGEHVYENALPPFKASFCSDMDNNQCPDHLAPWTGCQSNINSEDIKCERSCSGLDSEGESRDLKNKVKKKGVGRPPRDPKDPTNRTRTRRKSGQKCGRLWEFIRDLLKNQKYCPGDICWVDHDQGMFRFVQSERVAKLWGEIKKNPKMNYEKLSRAMRYYYKSKVLLPVLGRRLVYRFGPNATNWRSNNPNFLCKMTPSNQ